MSTPRLAPPPTLAFDGVPDFRIVILYEDYAAGRRAKDLSDRLLHTLGDNCVDVVNLWSFDVLGLTDVRNASTSAAKVADLVILSVSGARALSPEVEEWLELWAWLLDGTNPALLALFHQADGSCVAEIRARLYPISARKGLEFFTQSAAEPSPELLRAEREHLAEVTRWQAHLATDGVLTRAAQPAEKHAGLRRRDGAENGATPAARPGKTVLVVDDFPMICELVARHLSTFGFRVLMASDPSEVQRIVRAEGGKIDLLVTDVEMPKLRGDKLAGWFAQECPQTRVLFMTANPASLAGTPRVPFLQKPFSFTQLNAAVRAALAPEAAAEPALASAA